MMKLNVFPEIPEMETREGIASECVHYGAGNYVTMVDHTTMEEYEVYLEKLESIGYQRFVDNGVGLDGVVFTTTLIKGNVVLTITYIKRRERTYISFCTDLPLSEHLFYKEDYVKDNDEDAKTTLHMLELWNFGNSFVIQLKNGHFVISDGASGDEIHYLLDYLESLVPKGEKPIIEAWFITHGHGDHHGALGAFCWDKGQELCKRVIVEGVYFNEPSDKVYYRDPWSWLSVVDIRGAVRWLRNSEGRHPVVYRPQTGQRYYFNDITIDIVHTQEQLPNEEYWNEDYPGDFNDSSTWSMVTIEGQKVFLTGDGDVGGMEVLMKTYDKSYFEMDIMTLMHHGFNTYDKFSDYIKVDTVLATVKDRLPSCRERQNAYFRQMVKEWLPWGDGTKVFTFPYRVGEYEKLPSFDWKYHVGRERPEQGNL